MGRKNFGRREREWDEMCAGTYSIKRDFLSMAKKFYSKHLKLIWKLNQDWCVKTDFKEVSRNEGILIVGKKSRSGGKSTKYIFTELSFSCTLYRDRYQEVRCLVWQDRKNGIELKSFLYIQTAQYHQYSFLFRK